VPILGKLFLYVYVIIGGAAVVVMTVVTALAGVDNHIAKTLRVDTKEQLTKAMSFAIWASIIYTVLSALMTAATASISARLWNPAYPGVRVIFAVTVAWVSVVSLVRSYFSCTGPSLAWRTRSPMQTQNPGLWPLRMISCAKASIDAAGRDGRVIGSAVGCALEKSGSHTGLARPDNAGFLGFAAVFPSERGHGAGRALGETVLDWAGQAGFGWVVTDWRVTNLLSSRTRPPLGFAGSFLRLHRLIGY
jgi:GNAT superfamily N-acetyltransferase